jgi:cytochrome c
MMETFLRRLILVLACGISAACGPVQKAPGSADLPPAPAPLDSASLANADLRRGEALSLACQACHLFAADAGHGIGPNLGGVFGRRSASLGDFSYSDALLGADLVWTPAVLDAWLSDPNGFVPGSSMAFFGYKDPIDRRDLIAFLLAAVGDESDSP